MKGRLHTRRVDGKTGGNPGYYERRQTNRRENGT
jgi:hypothetical protein